MLLTLLGLSTLIFGLMRMAPGNPVDLMFNPSGGRVSALSAEDLARDRAELSHELGLDQPIPVQYVDWLEQVVLHGNLGYSIVNSQPAADLVLGRVPATLLLLGSGLLISLIVGVPLGIVAALHRNRILDTVISVAGLTVVATPTFFLGLALIVVFAVHLHWLPSGNLSTPGPNTSVLDVLRHMVLPVLVLGLGGAGPMMRYVRTSLLETLGREYLVTARAKGLTENRVIYKHALRNALLPVITLVGLSIGGLAAGAFVTEQVFSWPGMGSLALQAIQNRDYPVIQTYAVVIGFMVIVGNFLADVAYAVADPRIRLS